MQFVMKNKLQACYIKKCLIVCQVQLDITSFERTFKQSAVSVTNKLVGNVCYIYPNPWPLDEHRQLVMLTPYCQTTLLF